MSVASATVTQEERKTPESAADNKQIIVHDNCHFSQRLFARAVTFLTGELDRDGAWAIGFSPFLLQTVL